RAELVAADARPLVDLVGRAQPVDPLAGDRLDDEDPHAGTAARAAGAPPPVWTARAAACAAATALPGSIGRPSSIDTRSRTAITPRISSTVTDPRWPSRKIFPVSLPWPPARTTP